MSDYVRNFVFRYPIEKEDRERLDAIIEEKELGYRGGEGYFEICGTETADYQSRYFLDFVISSSYGKECDEFGRIRDIYPNEVEQFKPCFELLIPDIDMSKVKVVDYCWYNCSEPPAYYDNSDDPFYKVVEAPFAYWKKASGVMITPGGDPIVECSRCGGGKHLYGVENSTFVERCPQCGAKMLS